MLRDHHPNERLWGIESGLAWRLAAEKSVVYIDRGVSNGMKHGITAAKAAGIPVEYRSIKKRSPARGEAAQPTFV